MYRVEKSNGMYKVVDTAGNYIGMFGSQKQAEVFAQAYNDKQLVYTDGAYSSKGLK